MVRGTFVGHYLDVDVPTGRILRSVLMKPEHEAAVPELHRQLIDLLGGGPQPSRRE